MVEERAQCLCGTGGKNNNKKKRDEIVARDGRDVFPGVIVWLTAHSTAPAAALGAPQAAGPPPATHLLPLQVPPDQRDPGLPQLPPLVGEARLRLTRPWGSACAVGTAGGTSRREGGVGGWVSLQAVPRGSGGRPGASSVRPRFLAPSVRGLAVIKGIAGRVSPTAAATGLLFAGARVAVVVGGGGSGGWVGSSARSPLRPCPALRWRPGHHSADLAGGT